MRAYDTRGGRAHGGVVTGLGEEVLPVPRLVYYTPHNVSQAPTTRAGADTIFVESLKELCPALVPVPGKKKCGLLRRRIGALGVDWKTSVSYEYE